VSAAPARHPRQASRCRPRFHALGDLTAHAHEHRDVRLAQALPRCRYKDRWSAPWVIPAAARRRSRKERQRLGTRDRRLSCRPSFEMMSRRATSDVGISDAQVDGVNHPCVARHPDWTVPTRSAIGTPDRDARLPAVCLRSTSPQYSRRCPRLRLLQPQLTCPFLQLKAERCVAPPNQIPGSSSPLSKLAERDRLR
jgi:hypothetical protein